MLDIGADFGSTAAFFLNKGAHHVITVEGDDELYEQLERYAEKCDRVIPIHTTLKVANDFTNLISRYNPDIVKIDCEGCELFLLGMNPKLLRGPELYVIEMHDIVVRVGDAERQDLKYVPDLLCSFLETETNYELVGIMELAGETEKYFFDIRKIRIGVFKQIKK